jgi:hypothetical protein
MEVWSNYRQADILKQKMDEESLRVCPDMEAKKE